MVEKNENLNSNKNGEPTETPKEAPILVPEPKEVTLDDVLNNKEINTGDLTGDQLHNLVTQAMGKAREQEKRKLHDDLDKLKTTVKENNEVVTKLQSQIQVKEDEVENARREGLSTEEKLKEDLGKLQGQMQTLTDNLAKQEIDFQERLRKQTLETYRERRLRELRENGTQYVAGLVSGSTEEEIDNSIDTAVSTYKEILNNAVVELSGKNTLPIPEPSKEKPIVGTIKAPNASPETSFDITEALKNAKTSEEYAKIRDKALASVKIGSQRR